MQNKVVQYTNYYHRYKPFGHERQLNLHPEISLTPMMMEYFIRRFKNETMLNLTYLQFFMGEESTKAQSRYPQEKIL